MMKISKFGLCLVGALAMSGFAQSEWSGKDLNISFRDKRIDGFNFSNAKAVKNVTDFQRVAGEKPNFKGANLSGVSFQNAVISEANFNNAVLKGVVISGADIRSSDFKGADMEEANLYRATLLDSQFPQTNLKNARLDMMKVSEETGQRRLQQVGPDHGVCQRSGPYPCRLLQGKPYQRQLCPFLDG